MACLQQRPLTLELLRRAEGQRAAATTRSRFVECCGRPSSSGARWCQLKENDQRLNKQSNNPKVETEQTMHGKRKGLFVLIQGALFPLFVVLSSWLDSQMGMPRECSLRGLFPIAPYKQINVSSDVRGGFQTGRVPQFGPIEVDSSSQLSDRWVGFMGTRYDSSDTT